MKYLNALLAARLPGSSVSLGGGTFTAACLLAGLASLASAATVNLNPVHDAYVRDGTTSPNNHANTSFGTASTLMIKDGDVGYNRNTLLQFDLSSVNGIVTSATLKLYVSTKEGGSTAIPVRISKTADGWDSTVTWNSQPTRGDTLIAGENVTASSVWKAFEHADLTAYVAAEATGDGIVSFFVDDSGEKNLSVTFHSSEGTNQPVLEVTYDPADHHVLAAVDDAWIRDGSYQNDNYGATSPLEVKNGDVDYSRRALLKFDLASLAGEVVRARLRVYASSLENNATIPVTASRVASDTWIESGVGEVTWANQPSKGAAIAERSIATTGWVEYDVKDYVAEQLAGDRIVSFMLTDETTTNKNAKFHSKEGTNKPELVIDIVPAPVALQFIELEAYRDSYVRNGSYAGTAYGSQTTMLVKNGATDYNREAYVRFNLGVVNGTVHGAEMKLYVTTKESGSDPVTVNVYGVANDSWFETDVNADNTTFYGIDWNNKPAAGSLIDSFVVTGAGWHTIDVGDYVASQAVAGDTFASFVLKADENISVTFSTREGSNPPKLAIDYEEGLRAFPGAAGPGGATRGAYAGSNTPAIRRVTNRNASGAGSFQAAVEDDTPAIVVFDVGGQFPLPNEVSIGAYKTIIGETAPEPVTFLASAWDWSTTANRRLAIRGSQVVVTGVRTRSGTSTKSDGIFVTRGNNDPITSDVIVAFCSMSWAGDEIGGVWNGCHRVTFQYNILGEPLEPSYGTYSSSNNLGFYFGSNREECADIAFVRNLVTTVKFRVVGFKRVGSAVVAENIIYNWASGDGALIVYDSDDVLLGSTKVDVLNNVLVAGPWTTAENKAAFTFQLEETGVYHVSGNVTPQGNDYISLGSSETNRVYPGSYTPVVSGAANVEAVVLGNAGARIDGDLDPIDQRKVNQYLTNSAKNSNTPDFYEETVGGQTVVRAGYKLFDEFEATQNASARADTDSDGIYDGYETALGVAAGSLDPHTVITANDSLGSQWVGYTRIEHQRHWLRTGSL